MSKITVRPELNTEQRKKLDIYSDILAHLLFHRGLVDAEDVEKFLNPEYETGINDPFLFADMDKAVDIVLKSIIENKKICIYSDYDADGIPGAVILSDFFEKIGFENFFVYIPHRNREGFGLNIEAIDKIKEKGTDLIITIDCGIADVTEVEYANSVGLQVIVTDHHEPNGKEPKASAIINHKQSHCNYPDKNLCGSGVCFKFVQALIQKGEFSVSKGWEKWLLDLVGIATLSDMVPLVGENRIFATYGLKVLAKTKRKGIQKIFEKRRVDIKNLSGDDIVFMVTPQINAASRMGDPMLAYELLKETDEMKAEIAVKHLEKINNERKGQVAVIVKEIKKHIENPKSQIPPLRQGYAGQANPKICAVGYGNPNWQPSLLGLACNAIGEEYKVPVFIWGRGDGKELKGSCRTGNGDNLVEIMNELEKEGILETFGGHHGAGGFVIKQDKVSSLQETLEKIMERIESKDHEEIIDLKISIDDINLKLVEEINRLAPFGIGNPKPTFLLENIAVSNLRPLGATGSHLEISFNKSNGERIKAIEFYKTAEDLGLELNKNYNLIVNLEINNFNGRKESRIKIVKIIS
jgi:single-stranded-DNA-specific exonuclease